MNKMKSTITVTAAALSFGCSGEPPASTTNFAVAVAPLTLPGITDATYRLTTRNGDDEIVWQADITSTRYGDSRGAATYIGSCDASSNPNTVALELLALNVGDDRDELPAASFENPAPIGSPIVQTVTCVENVDVPVTFNLAIMRDAEQGFFDVAVNFDDIFCSAKLDCGVGNLLHDPASGERAPTVNIGFACTAGNDEPSWLYLSDVVVDCGDVEDEMHLDLGNLEPGNQGPVGAGVFQWGLYRGVEFTQAQVAFDKCFTNVAIGLSPAYVASKSCVIRAQGTAAATSWEGGQIPDDLVYPIVEFAVPITSDGESLACSPMNHGLNGVESLVTTRYVRPGDGAVRFPQAMNCESGEVETKGELVCNGAIATGSEGVAVRAIDGGIRVSLNGLESSTYRLPSVIDVQGVSTPISASLGTTCCVDPCCQ